jgi:hypothetical protein
MTARLIHNLTFSVAVVLAIGSLAAPAAAQDETGSAATHARTETAVSNAGVLSLSGDWPEACYLSAAGVEAPQGWRLTIGVPLWLPGLDGDLTVRGIDFSADQQTDDVVDLLDEHLNFALALHVEAQKGRLGFFTDFMYVSVAADRDTLLGTTIEGDVRGFIGEAAAFYTLYSTRHARDGSGGVPLRIDGFGGLRVAAIGLEIDTENFGSVDGSRTLWDPFVGLRGEVGLLKWLSVKGRADIGGFGLFDEHSSDLTWNASAAASFHLTRWCNLDAGYRWLSYDYEDGSGFDRFALDAMLHGPYIQIDFMF